MRNITESKTATGFLPASYLKGDPQKAISDLQCPYCVAENDAIGGGVGYAARYFNHAGELWAVCAVHQVRWYVTRELSLVDRNERLGHPDPGAASKLPEVEVSFASSANGGRCNSFTQERRPSWAISPTRARHDRPLSEDKKGLA